ncbi:hypothetical protein FRC00_007801 [Tulasnella sp. 408]|nr:hypothetical protein FRC00_007801 [Tulasnella sp. 408]
MTSTKRPAEGPVGEEPPMKKIKLAGSNEDCPYDRPTCVHGRAFHHATVVGETYGIDQGVAVWCIACNTICDFELFSGPDAVPQPEFTSSNHLVLDEEDEIIEPPLEVLFLGDSRRASGLNGQNAHP